ncbi:hypothetical protein TSIB_1778 [Thermococcus sibiricus MM 739]|uniref:Uncharacterized protein n=1 Tax=Thermococcus sibiricus (strain DSM 12597 / MM 739) TaxID=604354 RepID=C6A5D4_THESM|nr:hypothetical protein TSIB_1778 [Thermococcus sibiricus MM 739]
MCIKFSALDDEYLKKLNYRVSGIFFFKPCLLGQRRPVHREGYIFGKVRKTIF